MNGYSLLDITATQIASRPPYNCDSFPLLNICTTLSIILSLINHIHFQCVLHQMIRTPSQLKMSSHYELVHLFHPDCPITQTLLAGKSAHTRQKKYSDFFKKTCNSFSIDGHSCNKRLYISLSIYKNESGSRRIAK